MRKIKYRGFHVNEYGNTVITVNGEDYRGKWVYGYYYELKGTAYIIEKGTGYFDISCGERIFATAYCREVIPETVSQYTGLPDKNGKTIFENDILLGVESGDKYKVIFKDGCFLASNITHPVANLSVIGDSGRCFEIIGNIFDNPEEIESEE